jgi:dCMP deaminase
MTSELKSLNWQQLKTKDKQQLNQQRPIFVLGARDISQKRIQQLNQKLAAKRPVVWGCLTDDYIPGLEDSPQFKSLTLAKLKNSLKQQKTVGVLNYPQRYAKYILKEINWSAVIAIHGSWHKAFHYRPEYYVISQKQLPYKLVSSFVDETEAKKYFTKIESELPSVGFKPNKKYTDEELLEFAARRARHSFDYTFQTGAVLAKDGRVLAAAHNRVLPYETYMLHKGASKEKHLAPPHDLNYFDTNHAEVELILTALDQGLDLTNSSLYINLLPCPICARMLARTPIKEIIYQHDHSQGYGLKLLTQAGKTLRRIAIK